MSGTTRGVDASWLALSSLQRAKLLLDLELDGHKVFDEMPVEEVISTERALNLPSEIQGRLLLALNDGGEGFSKEAYEKWKKALLGSPER